MLETKLTELAMIALDFAIIAMTRYNRSLLEKNTSITKKVYVALDVDRVRSALATPSTEDDLLEGDVTFPPL